MRIRTVLKNRLRPLLYGRYVLKRFRKRIAGSWIFAYRPKNGQVMSLEAAKQAPYPLSTLFFFGAIANSLIGFIPFGLQLYRFCYQLAYQGERYAYLPLVLSGSRYMLLINDPRSVVVPGDTQEFKKNLPSKLASTCDAIFDVGANHGSFSCAALSLALDRHNSPPSVWAFEPNPQLRYPLLINMTYFGASTARVITSIVGSAGEEDSPFFVDPKSSGSSRKVRANETLVAEQGEVIIARTVALDDYTQDVRGKIFLKVDVEGSELDVLRGGTRFLRMLKPIIFMEVSIRAPDAVSGNTDYRVAELVNILAYCGYTRFVDQNSRNASELQTLTRHSRTANILTWHQSCELDIQATLNRRKGDG